ncbi:MAG: carbohydrate binding domain-containing protein, partial [Bacillota bacterium]
MIEIKSKKIKVLNLLIVSLAVFSLLVLGGCKGIAEDQKSNLKVQIKTADGQSVSADVQALYDKQEVSSKQGSAVEFELVKDKEYQLRVSADDYKTKTVGVQLTEDNTMAINLEKKTNNLIDNGDFSKELNDVQPKDNGQLDSQGSWSYHQSSNGQGEATTNGEQAKIKVNDSGDNPWSTQLMQGPITLEESAQYKVIFQAKADKKADLHLKIGAIGNRDWTGYQEQDFELTKELETYQFDFTMDEKTDPQARFEFWFLNQANYTIDNVKLIKVQAGTEDKDEEQEQVEIKSEDIITNGSFTNQTTGWETDGDIDIAAQSDQLKSEINEIG